MKTPHNVSTLLFLLGCRAGLCALPLDQSLTPAGNTIPLALLRPKILALSPDGRLLVTSGSNDQIVVLDASTGAERQRVPLPAEGKTDQVGGAAASFILIPDAKAQASFGGLAFSPDGKRLYLSDVNGTIKVFGVDPSGNVAGVRSFPLPLTNAPRRKEEIPAGLGVSADGKRLYVVANLSNGLLELDADSGAVLHRFEVGVAPYDVVLIGDKAYVSNWGGRRPAADSPTGPGGRGTIVRVDPVRAISSEGSVTVIDLKQDRVLTELLTGRHASGLARTPDGRYVAVANANEDTVSVIDTRKDQMVETISLRWHPGDLFGASPNALTFDPKGKTLYVCNGTQNAIAVVSFRPGKSRLEGLIPVGWYPGAITVDAKRRQLCVANLKGEGEEAPSTKHAGSSVYQFIGSLSLVPVPDATALKQQTATVLANYRQAVMQTALAPARPDQPVRPVPERSGEPSRFQHVIYIIKENRTYDQVLGDMKEGNGDVSLCIFGENVSPNLHKLAREFVLLDNTYCAGVLSADGHLWATSAFVTDYVEKAFSDFPRSYTFGGYPEGVDAMAYAPTGFIWDNALAHGVSLRDYGEFTLADVRWKNPDTHKTKPDYADIWRDYTTHAGEILLSDEPGIASLAKHIKTDTVGWNLVVSDQFRVDKFLEEFHAAGKTGDLPRLMILYLPQDHTQGTKPGVPTPAAHVADNDLAVGRVVDALSHSPYWKDTCLFAIEDDPQNGWDHVSGYRTTAYVASAYTKRHATVSDKLTQPGLLRTIELILGLPPMNQMDATATPWTACFTETADATPFVREPNRVPLDQLNAPAKALGDAILLRDALASAKLPLERPDECPEDVLNQILWRAQKGVAVAYPQWAILPTADDDDESRLR